MAPPAYEATLLTTAGSFTDEIHDDWHEFEVLGGDEPKILVKKASIQSEKQISVDPISLRALSVSLSMKNESFNLMLPPAVSRSTDLAVPLPMPLPPVKTKFVSCSLPNSAATSPKFGSIVSENTKKKENGEPSPLQTQELGELSVVQEVATAFRRSKSCGEGRACAPSLDFDLFLHYKPKFLHTTDQYDNNKHHQTGFSSKSLSSKSHGSFFSKTDSHKSNKSLKSIDSFEDGFKCSALCLYLPGFGKGKPVRSSRKDNSLPRTTTMSTTRTNSLRDNTIISARASLEKFECGSWASSALIHEEGGDSGAHFFDLPSELITGGVGNDEPVSAAFLFDKEPLEKEIKGVLKTTSSKSRRSTESPRHVRFSTSSPVSYPVSPTSSITPRLLRATEDFTTFLEAQST